MSLMEGDVRFLACAELEHILGKKICDAVVVDVRPFSDYVVGHVPGAFSVRLSSILIRRLAQNKIAFVDIVKDDQKERFRKWVGGSAQKKVVVYDESCCGTDVAASDPAKNTLLTVFRSLTRDFADVNILEGGYTAFKACCAHMVESDDGEQPAAGTTTAATVPPPLASLHPNLSTILHADCYADLAAERSPYDKHLRDQHPSEILPYLFIGSQQHAQNRALLTDLRITHVLNITATCPNWFPDMIQYKTVLIKDTWNQNIASYFEECFNFIDGARNASGRVLVHCVAGISRSPTITIAYLMRTESMLLKDALAFVKARRSIIAPNLDFLVELEQYERQLFPSLGPAPPTCSPEQSDSVSRSSSGSVAAEGHAFAAGSSRSSSDSTASMDAAVPMSTSSSLASSMTSSLGSTPEEAAAGPGGVGGGADAAPSTGPVHSSPLLSLHDQLCQPHALAALPSLHAHCQPPQPSHGHGHQAHPLQQVAEACSVFSHPPPPLLPPTPGHFTAARCFSPAFGAFSALAASPHPGASPHQLYAVGLGSPSGLAGGGSGTAAAAAGAFSPSLVATVSSYSSATTTTTSTAAVAAALAEPPTPLFMHTFSVPLRNPNSPRGSPRFARRADPSSPISPAQGIFVL